MDLFKLASTIEKSVPGTRTAVLESINQIIVTFESRPGIEVALLTPYEQRQIMRNHLDDDLLTNMVVSLTNIASAKY